MCAMPQTIILVSTTIQPFRGDDVMCCDVMCFDVMSSVAGLDDVMWLVVR